MKNIIYWLKVICGIYDTDKERNYCKYSKDIVDYRKVGTYGK